MSEEEEKQRLRDRIRTLEARQGQATQPAPARLPTPMVQPMKSGHSRSLVVEAVISVVLALILIGIWLWVFSGFFS